MGAQASTSNASGAPSPDEGCGHSREGETETREAVQGIGGERGPDGRRGHGDEGERRHGVPRHGVGALVAAEDEEAPGGEREKEEVDGHDVAEDRLVGADERESDGDAALERDGNRRDPGPLAHAGHGAEEDPVLGHREVDAGRGEDRLAQEPESGYRDARGDRRASARPQRARHHVEGGSAGRGEARGSQGAQADERNERVERDDAEDAGEERAREIAARILHLAGDEARGLPAAVRKEDGYERRTEIREGAPSRGRGRRRFREDETAGDECEQGAYLQHHEKALHRAAGADAEAIDERQQSERGRRERAFGKR